MAWGKGGSCVPSKGRRPTRLLWACPSISPTSPLPPPLFGGSGPCTPLLGFLVPEILPTSLLVALGKSLHLSEPQN